MPGRPRGCGCAGSFGSGEREEAVRSLAGLLLQESGQRALMWADGRARLRLF